MNSHPLSRDYLLWLTSQIRGVDDGHPDRSYNDLCAIMFEKEFVWHVPNDGNRLGDGLGLRVEYCREVLLRSVADYDLGSFIDRNHPNPPCSFLEVLIGLSKRLAFAAGGRNAAGWAWLLLNNLRIHRMTDPIGRGKARRLDDILDTCIWRNYGPDGVGGFFPLEQPFEDQTKVEIWYQMAAFIDEIERAR